MRYPTWIPGPTAFQVRPPKECNTPPNVKTGRTSKTAEWIAENAPPHPRCFPDRGAWVSWLISAQLSGTSIMGAIRGAKPIDYCGDCTAEHRVKMREHPGGNRCFPVVLRKERVEA